MPNKTSPLDLLPVNILKSLADFISPYIAHMANLSFSTGTFPTKFKTAQVTPILKKQGLDIDNPANYRPILNLQTLSKLLEKLYLSRLKPHLAPTGRMDPCQSAYRSNCSTETALLKVTSDLCGSMDNGNVSMLVTLDISAAFDTIDSSILFDRMKLYFGVDGKALCWIKSYLDQRSQYVKLNGVASPVFRLQAGVPQGSVLGPELFSSFIAPLADVIKSFGLTHHQYADDTNLYHSFSARNQQSCIDLMTDCLNSVNNLFLTNGLLVNPNKSDSMFVGTAVQLKKIVCDGIRMGGEVVPLSSSVKSLGVIVDRQIKLDSHVKNVCRICNFHSRGLRSLRSPLDDVTAETIGRAIVMSRVDYCNSLLSHTSAKNIHSLQLVQNSLARVVSDAAFRDRIRPVLARLHWLSVKQRIDYKLSTLVFKSRLNSLPDYLSRGLVIHESLRPVLFSLQDTYDIPRVRTEMAKHSFYYAGVKCWNSLPNNLRLIISFPAFKKLLKTHFFNIFMTD